MNKTRHFGLITEILHVYIYMYIFRQINLHKILLSHSSLFKKYFFNLKNANQFGFILNFKLKNKLNV